MIIHLLSMSTESNLKVFTRSGSGAKTDGDAEAKPADDSLCSSYHSTDSEVRNHGS